MNSITKQRSGFVALVSVLLISALVFVIAIGVSSRSFWTGSESLAEESSHRALFLAESCAEYALAAIVSDLGYAGGEVLAIKDETCEIGVISTPEPALRSFETESTVSRYTRRIRVETEIIASSTRIVNWENLGSE